VIDNPSDETIQVWVRKRENQADVVAEIFCDEQRVTWTNEFDHLVFGERIEPRSERCFQLVYREQANAGKMHRSLRFELSVAVRRLLCEFRDNYLSGSRLLSTTSESLKNMLTKVN
jgi:hypothetical protein